MTKLLEHGNKLVRVKDYKLAKYTSKNATPFVSQYGTNNRFSPPKQANKEC